MPKMKGYSLINPQKKRRHETNNVLCLLFFIAELFIIFRFAVYLLVSIAHTTVLSPMYFSKTTSFLIQIRILFA